MSVLLHTVIDGRKDVLLSDWFKRKPFRCQGTFTISIQTKSALFSGSFIWSFTLAFWRVSRCLWCHCLVFLSRSTVWFPVQTNLMLLRIHYWTSAKYTLQNGLAGLDCLPVSFNTCISISHPYTNKTSSTMTAGIKFFDTSCLTFKFKSRNYSSIHTP